MQSDMRGLSKLLKDFIDGFCNFWENYGIALHPKYHLFPNFCGSIKARYVFGIS